MKAYYYYAKSVFLKNKIYKFDYIMGILSTLMQIFIYISIWKALYHGKTEIGGIGFQTISTTFILGLAMSNTFILDDFIIYRKIQKGDITNELLKPINFAGLLIAENIGNILFKMIVNLIPSVLISSLFINFILPYNFMSFFMFLSSMILGFFILFGISFIVSVLSFWFINIWSISTIKNVIISILSGTMIPLWFMPPRLLHVMKYTPFESIYFIPIKIYLGEVEKIQILKAFVTQSIWIFILFIISFFLWKEAIKKLVIQGG